MEDIKEKTHAGKSRAEYIKVETNVNLHITDAGEGKPIVLIHGWPLSDEMYEYQYNDLAKITIPTLITHGKKDKICSFDLAEQMKAGITDSHLVAFEKSGHSLFLEETKKFNSELIKFSNKSKTDESKN